MQCNESQERWYRLIIDSALTKTYVNKITKIKNVPKYIIPIYFDNKGLQFIHLNAILHNQDVINCLPESLQNDEVPSTVYKLTNTIRNKIFNYKETVNNINKDDNVSYGTYMQKVLC